MIASWRPAVRLLALALLLGPLLAACGTYGLGATVKRSAFSSKEYGVAVSPRVTTNPNPPKGGGRFMLGKPYTVRGKVYTPTEDPNYRASGEVSWYGSDFHGRRTANGEIFSANAITGAHPTLPLPSYVRVTNKQNGRSVIVRVNDRGPYMPGRIMDLSHRAAEMLGYVNNGHTDVDVQYMGRAPLEGDDTRMLVASYQGPAITGGTRYADGTNSLADMAGNFFGSMFSYADPISVEQDAAITSAHAAVNAVATANPDLSAWVAAVDADTRAVSIPIGTFADPSNAIAVSERFAVLGAVDEKPTTVAGQAATHLILTRLKPGVAPADVQALAAELGLGQIVR